MNGTDWLNGLREDSAQDVEQDSEQSVDASPEETVEEVPDWLARIRTREQMEREALSIVQPEQEESEENEDLPDWLKEIKAGNSGLVNETTPPESPAFAETSLPESTDPISNQPSEDDTQEWLSKLAAWRPAEDASIAGDEPQSVVEEVKPLEFPSDETPEISSSVEESGTFSDLNESEFRIPGVDPSTGWQITRDAEPEIHADQQPSAEETPIEIVNDALAETNPDIAQNLPFDFEELQAESSSDEINANDFDGSVAQSDSQFPDGKSGEKGIDQEDAVNLDGSLENGTTTDVILDMGEPDFPETSPFSPDDLPDWLATAAITKKGIEEVSEELDGSVLDSSAEKASLPAWLQAIRPSPPEVFTTQDEVFRSPIDEDGLLSGIEGTLKTPEVLGAVKKPVGYGSSLKVTDRQKANANLFARMAEDTLGDQEYDVPQKGRTKHVFWRLLLALIIFAIIISANFLPAQLTIKPAIFPPEVVDVYDAINSLPLDKPVLLIGDYEAAVFGELNWSSQAMLEHLMRRDLNLVIFSTNPSGSPMLVEQVRDSALKITGYDLESKVTNFGYLPGGHSGISYLSRDLRAAIPYAIDFKDGWNGINLQSVFSLNDFGALVVLSDKMENARAWVEQVQPGLEGVPLLFVISAQSGPLLQPYYQSGQVSGFLSGFIGSLAYEQLIENPSAGLTRLNAYQVVILVIALLIFIGGLVNLVKPANPERKGQSI